MVREARLQTLMADFNRIKLKETDTIDEFVGKLSKLSTKSAALGKILRNQNSSKVFLIDFHERDTYISLWLLNKSSILKKKKSFEIIVGRLKVFTRESTMKTNKTIKENLCMLIRMHPHTKKAMIYIEEEVKVDAFIVEENGSYRQGRDKRKVVCYRCNKTGCYASFFPDI